MSKQPTALKIRALRTSQSENVPVYAFFVPGADLLSVAEISRIHRPEGGELEGFQRDGIRKHVASILEYLDSGRVLFPNAIILALGADAKFAPSRGFPPEGLTLSSESGTLTLPIRDDGSKSAWIVDGQQRSLALSQAKNKNFPVPVIAFMSDDIGVHREQFILVNKARPLSPRLVDELLPEVDTALPRDLAARKIPSTLVNNLNQSPKSPFYKMIRRASDPESKVAVITDSALLRAIKVRIESPLGALASYRSPNGREADVQGMYDALVTYWSAVKAAFPQAWGLPPAKSRLMHSVGIEVMSALMDRLFGRAPQGPALAPYLREALNCIAPSCHWTSGRWDDIERDWNEIQNTHRDIRQLTTLLLRLDHMAQRPLAA